MFLREKTHRGRRGADSSVFVIAENSVFYCKPFDLGGVDWLLLLW